jgi:hypothetical protein
MAVLGDIDTSIPGQSAEKTEAVGQGTMGRWGRMVLAGEFELGNQNEEYYFRSEREALAIMGNDPNFSGTLAIKQAFKRDRANGNMGITGLICVPARKATPAKITLQGTLDGEDDPEDLVVFESLEGKSGNSYAITVTPGTFSGNKFLVKKGDANVYRKDNVTVATVLRQLKNNKSLNVKLADSVTLAQLETATLETVLNEQFTGGTEQKSTILDLFDAMKVVEDEFFARFCFTDVVDDLFFEGMMEYGDNKFKLGKGSSIYLGLDPEFSLNEAIQVASESPTNSITFIQQTFNELSLAESVVAYAATCSGVVVGDSVAHGEIGWIERIVPSYNIDEQRALVNNGITVFKLKNKGTDGYGVGRAVTASQMLDENGNKAAEAYQHGTDTLFFCQWYLDAEHFLAKTGIARTKLALEAWLNDRAEKLIGAERAAAIDIKVTVHEENSGLFVIAPAIKVNREAEWFHYAYTLEMEEYVA